MVMYYFVQSCMSRFSIIWCLRKRDFVTMCSCQGCVDDHVSSCNFFIQVVSWKILNSVQANIEFIVWQSSKSWCYMLMQINYYLPAVDSYSPGLVAVGDDRLFLPRCGSPTPSPRGMCVSTCIALSCLRW